MPKKDSEKPTDSTAVPAATKLAALWRYPDVAMLAQLVAQPRFALLPDERAINAALLLLHKCQSAIIDDAYYWQEQGKIEEEWKGLIQRATQFTLEEFYRLIVNGKDTSNKQHRFFQFLETCYQRLKAYRDPCVLNMTETEWATAELARLRDKGFTEDEWYVTATGFKHWWKCKSLENKRKGGLERVRKFRREKKAP